MQPELISEPPRSRRNLDLPATRERNHGEAASVPAPPRLEQRLDGKLWLLSIEPPISVEIVRCFPWSEPNRFLSLRDANGEERAFVAAAAALEERSQRALIACLSRSGFVFEVTRVLSVSEDFELRSFKVETLQGTRVFQTALDAWPRELEGGGLVLEDVFGDLFRIAAPRELDRKSQELLSAFID